MTHDAEGAIRVLRGGLDPARPSVFVQADALVRVSLSPPFPSFPSPSISLSRGERAVLRRAVLPDAYVYA